MLVAHNAPFDVGFLRHFAEQQGRPWPTFEVVDTARLARRVITRDDAPNCKLSSLARVFNSGDHAQPPRAVRRPGHRRRPARPDGAARRARASTPSRSCRRSPSRVSTAQRRKRHLAEGLPHAPGVYLFRDDQRRVLYVGTSRDLRTRVRTYFTASETRSRMGEMVGLAEPRSPRSSAPRRSRPRSASCG